MAYQEITLKKSVPGNIYKAAEKFAQEKHPPIITKKQRGGQMQTAENRRYLLYRAAKENFIEGALFALDQK